MSNLYEIEIKSLLGSHENAEALVQRMEQHGGFTLVGSHKQLNHYFNSGGDASKLINSLSLYLPEEKQKEFQQLLEKAMNFSLRTRWADGKVILVLKASIDETTSSNGTARLELEQVVPISIEELDKLLLSAGFAYQAKWSRERTEYKYKDANVCIDKNAGYGYLAEFEVVESDPQKAPASKESLRNLMNSLGVEELPQDRLARMFDFYNAHWQEYYGTDKVFTIQ